MSKIAGLIFDSTMNGEGVRCSIFFSGCNNHCEGCFNQKAWDFDYGVDYTKEIENKIFKYCENDYVDGISILGGEPLDERNYQEVENLILKFKEKFADMKDIWLWTGYDIKVLAKRPELKNIFANIDYIVEGPFKKELYSSDLKWRGSSNQNVFKRTKGSKFKNINDELTN